jgi:hypothetical protein
MHNLNNHDKTFAVCVTHCYKCRIFKKRHPKVHVIELRNSIEGFGDIISIIAYWLHIPHCAKCENRRNILNEKFPMTRIIPLEYRLPRDRMSIRRMIKKYKGTKFPLVFNWDTESRTYALLHFTY